MDKDRHSANSSHETSFPRGSGVHTVHILQGLLGFVFKLRFLQGCNVRKVISELYASFVLQCTVSGQ